jgi:transposase-like protein
MAKLSGKEIQKLARSIVNENPGGIRYSELVEKISQQSPETPKNTVHGSVWNLDTIFPNEITKPSRGLFTPVAKSVNEAADLLDKALVVVAAQEDGPGIGRIRMRQIVDASAASLVPFVQDSVEPDSVIHTDGWLGYLPLESKGYEHEVTFLKGKKKTPSELMPRVHLVISLLERWLMGTHQGAVSHKHLDYYLDEFTFRFNRRRSKSRGKLFLRLAQQAVAVDPVTHYRIVHPDRRKAEGKPQSVGAW